jgi:hypothetical protein
VRKLRGNNTAKGEESEGDDESEEEEDDESDSDSVESPPNSYSQIPSSTIEAVKKDILKIIYQLEQKLTQKTSKPYFTFR